MRLAKKVLLVMSVVVMTLGGSMSVFAQGTNPFADVKESDWYYDYISYALDNDIIAGKGTDQNGLIIADPCSNITRAEFVQILYSREGRPVVDITDSFTDVKGEEWFAQAISWAELNKIVAGKGDYFDVNGAITRQEMATILCKYGDFLEFDTTGRAELTRFSDSQEISAWAVESMQWAVNDGIMAGKGKKIEALSAATRAEAVTMLKGFIDFYIGEISYSYPSREHIVLDEETADYYVDNQILIVAKSGTEREEIEKIISGFGGEIVGCISITNDYQVLLPTALPDKELNQIIEQLNGNDAIDMAMKNYLFEVKTEMVPNDSVWSRDEWNAEYPEDSNWGVEAINAMGAWDHLDQMRYVKVGVIDTMFDTNHEDLAYTKVWNNPNEIDNEPDIDCKEHGTHVSGTIAACFNNNKGIAGVAPKVILYGYSIKGDESDAILTDSNKDVMGLMEWKYALANLITSNCKVINVSMGYVYRGQEEIDEPILNYYKDVLGDFLNKMITKGYDYVIVQAAGNDSVEATNSGIFSGITVPEVKDRVLIVGAIGNNGSHKNGFLGWFGERVFDGYYLADFSNYGNRVDVVAPGVNICSTVPGNNYAEGWSGTSMAAPHVTGVAAMCYSVNPSLTGRQLKEIVVNTATTTVTDNTQNRYSNGARNYSVVNASAAVAVALSTSGEAVAPVNPSNGVVMGNVRGYDEENQVVALDAVEISAYRISDYDGNLTEYAAATTPDSDGNYELILEAGKYYINFYKEDYVPSTICDVMVTNDQITYLDNMILVRDSDDDINGNILGTVRNALTGSGIEGAEVKLCKGWNNMRAEDYVRNPQTDEVVSAFTNESGDYSLQVPEGCYTAEVSKDGFITGYVNVVCSGIDSTGQDVALTPVLSDDEYRIVLTWSSTPEDLDSHISGPLSDGRRFHVYFDDMNAYDNSECVANLDLDDVTSYGPETVTLKKNQNGVYRYAVHDYTNREMDSSSALSMSGAKVDLYSGNRLIATYRVPINVTGTVWNVFEIEGDQVRLINTMESISEPAYVCMDDVLEEEEQITREGGAAKDTKAIPEAITSSDTNDDFPGEIPEVQNLIIGDDDEKITYDASEQSP